MMTIIAGGIPPLVHPQAMIPARDDSTAPLLTSVGRTCAWLAFGLAALALAGWIASVSALIVLVPGGPPMMPLTAMSLIALALGAALKVRRAPPRLYRLGWMLLGLLVAAVGAAILAEYLLGVDLIREQALFAPKLAGEHPGRPSAPTAMAFCCLGSALALSGGAWADGRFVPTWMALTGGFIGLVALTGHLYGAEALYRHPGSPVIGVALSTSIAVVLVATSIALTGPRAGWVDLLVSGGTEGALLRRLGATAIVVPLFLGFLVQMAAKLGLRDVSLGFAVLASSLVPLGLALAFYTTRSVARAHHALAESLTREEELRRRIEALGQATVAISDAVAALPRSEIDALLTAIVLQARMLTGARYAALGIAQDATRAFSPWVYSGMPEHVVKELGRHPRPVGLLGRVALGGEVLRVADVAGEESFRGFPPGHPPMASFLGVPIRFQERIVGNLYLSDKEGAPGFTEDDEHVVKLLAARAGTALETAHSYGVEAGRSSWLQSVIDQMPEGVIVLNAAGRVEHINAAARAFAFPSETMDPLGNPFTFDVRWPSGEPMAWEDLPLTRAMIGRECVSGVQMLMRHPDGRVVPVLTNAGPIMGQGTAVGGAVAVFQDITVLKTLERLREEWTAVVAHDLRQPIGVIALAAAVLGRSGPLTEQATKALERIRASTGCLSRMIADLLDASRIEAHRLDLHRRGIDLRPLIDEVVERAAGPELPVVVRAPDDVPVVYADAARVEQILGNLLSNAGKYGEPGAEVVIRIEPGPDEVAVSVTNPGPGLTDEERTRLCTRFYRTADARNHREGLGLGLYIVKGLVDAHGGRFEIESQPDRGATFRFTLPVVHQALASA